MKILQEQRKEMTNLLAPQVLLAVSKLTPCSQSCSSKDDQHQFCAPSTHTWVKEAEEWKGQTDREREGEREVA